MTVDVLELILHVSVGLVVLGLGGMILRRSILVVVMSGALAVLGASMALFALGTARADGKGIAAALLLLLLASAWSVMGAAVALASYRRRGTENLDELRELR